MSESVATKRAYIKSETHFPKISAEDLQKLLDALPGLGEKERQDLLRDLSVFEEYVVKEKSQTDFLTFVKKMWPDFVMGRHHRKMAKAFEKVANGECKRLIINMPPRHTKSEFASYLLPAWFLGKYPQKKVIQTSHTAELSVGFGRKVRNLVGKDEYRDIFPHTALQADSKAAGRWNTSKGGDYFAIGVGGAVTGKGADLLIIDDPHSEQEATLAEHSPEIYDKVHEWYTSGPRQRLQPGGAIVIVMTRWSKRDLTGQVVKSALQRDGEEWEVIEFPAIMPSGNALWPEFWSLDELATLRNELPHSKWMAQYQQDPTSEASAIIKRDWWRCWPGESPPPCNFVLMSWDTAFEKNNRADYSACTVWGVFNHADSEPVEALSDTEEQRNKARSGFLQPNIILLNAYRDRLEFPELKRVVMEEYKSWDPDSIIIEKKASGAPLIYELRSMGIPVQEFTPTRGNDKISRLNAVSDIFASGKVWYPPTRWAEEVIEEVGSFPAGEHDDYVDSTSMALMRFRKGGYIRTSMDEVDEYDTNAHRAYRQFNNRARYY
jgi:predicted phage terminase large subunit-like protein